MFSPRCILSFPSFHCFSVQQSVCLYVRSGNFHSSRIRCARFFIIVRFCVFQLPLQDGLPILNAYDIRQVVRSYGSGSGWLRHGSGCIVKDETGHAEGIITMEDIIEKLMGDILDEFDKK